MPGVLTLTRHQFIYFAFNMVRLQSNLLLFIPRGRETTLLATRLPMLFRMALPIFRLAADRHLCSNSSCRWVVTPISFPGIYWLTQLNQKQRKCALMNTRAMILVNGSTLCFSLAIFIA
jgi:hypothetical protein